MNKISDDYKFLILGAKGFIGTNLLNYLNSQQINTEGYYDRINESNVKTLSTQHFSNNTIVVNCMAKAVTPNTLVADIDLKINGVILEPLLQNFITSQCSKFIHLATKYETVSFSDVIPDRLQYVNSKQIGSAIVHKYIEIDPRIYILYLPTILNHNQPKGRFFIDFLTKGFKGTSFEISQPSSKIRVSTFSAFIASIIKILNNELGNICEVIDEGEMQVLELAMLINAILIQNHYAPVEIKIRGKAISQNLEINLSQYSTQFISDIEEYIGIIARKLL